MDLHRNAYKASLLSGQILIHGLDMCPFLFDICSPEDFEKSSSTPDFRILNFNNNDTVTYPIVKLLGIIENSTQPKDNGTEKRNRVVSLTLNLLETRIETTVFEDKFKLFCELQLGRNTVTLTCSGRTISLVLNYCQNQSGYSVMPLYIICDGHDGKFQAPDSEENDIKSACQRITLASKLLQCLTAEKLDKNSMGKKTFKISDSCQVFHSKLNYVDARKLTDRELWTILGREIIQSEIGSEKVKYMGFLSCTFYNSAKYRKGMTKHEDLLNITEAYVALGDYFMSERSPKRHKKINAKCLELK